MKKKSKLLIIGDIPSFPYQELKNYLPKDIEKVPKEGMSLDPDVIPSHLENPQDLSLFRRIYDQFSSYPDVILLHLENPQDLSLLRQIYDQFSSIPIGVLVEKDNFSLAFEAIGQGAKDFLVKPYSLAHIQLTLLSLLGSTNDKTPKDTSFLEDLCTFIGESQNIQNVYRQIERVASSTANVFITGESGTGKELVAATLHRIGTRRNKPFISVNCAAIPRDLLESELFGHEKGAFTGAITNRVGLAKQAHKGTLFLDEICEMPLELQVKLLRLIDTKIVQPVGSNKEEKVDVRIICATNLDPLTEIKNRRFREDLYYRLHVIPIHLPALRTNKEDIISLAYYFLALFAAKEQKNFTHFDKSLENLLTTYEWPGNVRQLQNLIHTLVVLYHGPILTGKMMEETFPLLCSSISEKKPWPEKDHTAFEHAPPLELTEILPLETIKQNAIISALKATENDVKRAALLLEVNPSTIHRFLKKKKQRE